MTTEQNDHIAARSGVELRNFGWTKAANFAALGTGVAGEIRDVGGTLHARNATQGRWVQVNDMFHKWIVLYDTAARNWVRLFTVDGTDNSGGGSCQILLTGTGQFGSPKRGMTLLSAAERAGVFAIQAWNFGVSQTIQPLEIYYVNAGTTNAFDVWVYTADFSQPIDMLVIGGHNYTIRADSIGANGPSNPTRADGVEVTGDVTSVIGRNKAASWLPPGANTTTLPAAVNYPPLTTVGTVTARAIATTNLVTRQQRLGFVSSNPAGSITSARIATGLVTTGTTTVGTGGFRKMTRFSITDAAPVSGARMFVGVSSSTGAATNVEPNTLTNAVGVGHGASDTNLKIFSGGSAAQNPVDLGVNFPITGATGDLYELNLAAPSIGNLYWSVLRVNTGHYAAGQITGTSVTLPTSTTLLTPMQIWRTNNATNGAVAFDLISDYFERDI